MKISEYGEKVKRENPEKIVLLKFGNFYRSFNNDALVIFYLFNYKITSKNSIGFPIKALNKVLIELKNKNISCIVVNGIDNNLYYECIDNKYNYYLDKAINYNLYCTYFNNLNDLIEKILSADINNYDKILEFLEKVSI